MSEPVLNHGAGPRVSPWKAVVRVLTDPAETFRAMAGKPPVLVPYLVHMLVGLAVVALTYGPTVDLAVQAASAALPPGQDMDFEMMQSVMRWSAAGSLVAGSVIGPWLIGFVLALVATFFGQFQGGGVPLTSYMGMIGYARLPVAISNLLAAILMAVTGRVANLSPAVLLPDTAGPVLAAVLSAFNPFHLWYYVLLGIGFAALFGREPRKGWVLPVALFVVTTLFTAASAGLNSALVSSMTLN